MKYSLLSLATTQMELKWLLLPDMERHIMPNKLTYYQSDNNNISYYCAEIGVGEESVENSLPSLLSLLKPTHVFLFGTSGALVPYLPDGSFVLANEIVWRTKLTLDSTLIGFDITNKITSQFYEKFLTRFPCICQGKIFSSQFFINKPQLKSEIHELFGAIAADLESGAVATYCSRHGITLTICRIIIDRYEQSFSSLQEYLIQEGLIINHNKYIINNIPTLFLSILESSKFDSHQATFGKSELGSEDILDLIICSMAKYGCL